MHEKYLRLAKEAAARAGEFLSKRKNIDVCENLAHDIKLSSDRESEKIILECLSESGLPVLSEECGFVGEEQNLRWIVDPLDGSVNYFKGMDELCCVSIALFAGDEPVLGVINRYACGELFCGAAGRGADLNGNPIKPSDICRLSEAVIATGFPAGRNYSDEKLMGFVHRVQRVKKVRMLGTAALMAAFVSCGRIDAYFEEGICLWDVAAAMAIVKSAGGAVSLTAKDGFKCDFGAFATDMLKGDFYGS